MNSFYSPIKAFFIALILSFSSGASAEVVVIVNSSVSIGSADYKEIADLYLNKRMDVSGIRLVPVDLSEGNSIRDDFYNKVTQKSPSQIKSYWSRLIFTGKAAPPKQYLDDMEVVDLVSENSEFVGYVNAEFVDERVNVIFVLP